MRPPSTLTIPITVARHVAEPLHEQIAGQVGTAIEHGLLAPRAQLPSTRCLASLLGVSRGVIIAAYELLFARGHVLSELGSGTFVVGALPAGPRGRGAIAAPRPMIDLRPGQPSTEAFPLTAWRAAWRRAGFRRPPAQALPPLGVPPLRRAIGEHLSRTTGICLSGKEVVVTRGIQHGLRLVLEALGLHGPAVAVEEPCPAALRRAAGDPAGLPIDAHGARVDRIPAGCRAIVISADGQIPHGHILSSSRREAAARWANQSHGHVIEIACDTVVRPELNGLPRLSALAPQRSVLIGSFTELLASGIQLGYALLPPDLAATAARLMDDIPDHPPYVAQLAMESLLDDGTVVRLMHRLGRLYAHKRRIFEHALGRNASGTVNCAVLPLPPGTNAAAVTDDLLRRSIRLTTLTPYHFSTAAPEALVIGYGHLPDPILTRALSTIRNLTPLSKVEAPRRANASQNSVPPE